MITSHNIKKQTRFSFFFNTILILYFIFNVNYFFLPYQIPSSYLILLFWFMLFIVNTLKTKLIYIPKISILLSLFLFFVVSSISYINNFGESDIYIIRTICMYVLITIVSKYIYMVTFRCNRLNVLKSIGYAGFFNSLFIISMLLYKPFQNWYLNLISEKSFDLIGGGEALNGLMSLRMIGITGFSAYSTGFVQVLCFLSYLLYIYYRERKFQMTLKDYIIILFIALSALISARSSIVGIFIVSIILLKITNIFSFSKTMINIIIAIAICLSAIIVFIPADFKDFFINWITEVFKSGTKTGSIQTNINMYIYSWSDFSFIGDSKWYGDNNDYYMNTDVGWYRLLFAVGYVGMISWLFVLISMIGIRNVFTLKINNNNFILIAVGFYAILMMFKGAILFDSFQSIFIILMLNYSIINKMKVKHEA
ncbi:hypothetical protein I5530_02760 [Citrobacter freundii]|nr:hypothetical protein [Citrobacter freundii]